MSAQLLRKNPVTTEEIIKLLTPTPINTKFLHNFHLVEIKEAVKYCLPYEKELETL